MNAAARFGILVALALVVCGAVVLWAQQPPKARRIEAVTKPTSAIPGDPQNAVTALRNIYRALIAHRKATGSLPRANPIVLLERPGSLAGGAKLERSDLYCVDAGLSEYRASSPVEASERYALVWNGVRPDGTKKPAFPKPGEKDLWACSKHYERSRLVEGGERSEIYGVRVGLFSDGSIEVVPSEKLVGVRRSANSWWTYFPGETGIPGGGMPIHEMQRQILADVSAAKKPKSR